MKKTIYNVVYVAIALIPIILTAILYKNLPSSVPTHFDMAGVADRFGNKSTIWLSTIVLFGISMFAMGRLQYFERKGSTTTRDLLAERRVTMVADVFLAYNSSLLVYMTYSYESGVVVNLMTFMIVPAVLVCGYAFYEHIQVFRGK